VPPLENDHRGYTVLPAGLLQVVETLLQARQGKFVFLAREPLLQVDVFQHGAEIPIMPQPALPKVPQPGTRRGLFVKADDCSNPSAHSRYNAYDIRSFPRISQPSQPRVNSICRLAGGICGGLKVPWERILRIPSASAENRNGGMP